MAQKRSRRAFEESPDTSFWGLLGLSASFVMDAVKSVFVEEEAPAASKRAWRDAAPNEAPSDLFVDASFARRADSSGSSNNTTGTGGAPRGISSLPLRDDDPFSPIKVLPRTTTSPLSSPASYGSAQLPSHIDLVEQQRRLEQFQQSFRLFDADPAPWGAASSSSLSFRAEEASRSSAQLLSPSSTRARPASSASALLPPLDAFYRDASASDAPVHNHSSFGSPVATSPKMSLADAATPVSSSVALNRMRILSEKFGVDPSLVPASFEDHLQWVREQDELDRLKSAKRVLRDLNDKEKDIYRKAMSGGSMDEIVSSSYVSDTLAMDLKRMDIVKMGPGKWLNDECINTYMKILQKRADDSKQKVYLFNTFFYPKLLEGYSKVERWTRRVDVFAMEKLLIPVHLGTHWCLAVMNLSQRRFEYYDSLHGGNPECLEAMRAWLDAESQSKRKKPFDWSGWQEPVVNGEDLPLQRNGYDCGVFACMFAEYLARDAYPDFTQADMDCLRRRMAVELLTGKLLSD